MNSDAQMGVIKQGFRLAQLGRISVLGRGHANVRKAPESLTGCGHEMPKGVLERTSGLFVEVRPVTIIPMFRLLHI